MKRSATILVLMAAAGLFANVQSKPQLTDKKQRFALWFSEASREVIDKDSFKLEVSGNPFHGYSRDQNLEFSALSFEGVVLNGAGGTMLLKSGTLTGSVALTVTDKDGSSTVKTGKVTLDDNGETATLLAPGALTFTNSNSGDKGERSMSFSAAHGTFTLKSLSTKDENPLIGAEVGGPVTIHVDEKGEKGKSSVYTMTGQNLTVTSQGTDKVLNLRGNVHLTGDQTNEKGEDMIGTWDVDQATVVLDKDYIVKKVSTKGNPGTGTLRDKKDGG